MEQTLNIGKPHMLVNNAGPVAIGKEADFMEMMNAAMGMNHFITSAFLEIKPVEGSSIVNISSIVGPIFGGGKYSLASICHVKGVQLSPV
jgi:3-oxoacyl-[acyl-carrier protein] reductase